LAAADQFNFTVVNDDLESVVEQLVSLLAGASDGQPVI
jgi:guanylate kinase